MFMKESCTYSSIMYEYVVFIPWYEAVWDLLFAIPVKNDKDTCFSIMVLVWKQARREVRQHWFIDR